MKNRMSRGQEVDIKALLYGMLKAWRPILGLALGCAVLLGGYRASRSLADQKDGEYVSEQQEQYEADLLVYESAKESYEQEISNIINSLAGQQEYLQDSILMKISPYEKCTASADLYIKTAYQIMPGMDYQDPDYTDALVKAYVSAVKEDALLEGVADSLGIELRYLKELITVTEDRESGVVTVTVAHQDVESARMLLELLLEGLESKTEILAESVGAHEVVVLSRVTDSVVDLTLSDSQQRIADSMTTLQESLEEKQQALDQLSAPSLSAVSRTTALTAGIKYGVMGGILGIMLGAFAACLFWLFCDKADDGSEVEAVFGFRELGAFADRKKRWFSRVDRMVDRLFGKRPADDDGTVYRRIETRLRYYYPDARSLYLSAMGRESLTEELAGRLAKAFPERMIRWGGSLAEDPEALALASGGDGVILVVERGGTTYQDIQRETEAAGGCGTRILGFILA